jgi:hypothetical protein
MRLAGVAYPGFFRGRGSRQTKDEQVFNLSRRCDNRVLATGVRETSRHAGVQQTSRRADDRRVGTQTAVPIGSVLGAPSNFGGRGRVWSFRGVQEPEPEAEHPSSPCSPFTKSQCKSQALCM